ncbi:MAG: hypothetical protein ACR2HH_17015 [Chthoniobacterales bacterium]
MLRLLALLIFVACSILETRAGKPHCTLRAHLETNASSGEVFSTTVHSGTTGREVTIEKIPAISERDVVAYEPHVAVDGTFGALFQLDDHGRIALDTLSLEKRGTSLHVFINGRPMAEMEIDRHVADGILYVPSGLTSADLQSMKKDWPRIKRTRK